MSRSDTAFAVITAFWAFIGVICPILVQFFMGKSPNKGIVQIMFVMTAVCCYLFWLCAFLFQLNPLIGPQLDTSLIRVMQYEWMGLETEHQHVYFDPGRVRNELLLVQGQVEKLCISTPRILVSGTG